MASVVDLRNHAAAGGPPIERFITAQDVRRALQCSLSSAYAHLARAAGRQAGDRGLLRVTPATWEAYARRTFERSGEPPLACCGRLRCLCSTGDWPDWSTGFSRRRTAQNRPQFAARARIGRSESRTSSAVCREVKLVDRGQLATPHVAKKRPWKAGPHNRTLARRLEKPRKH